MGAERRQYLRVLFEETIEIRTKEWTDPVATGLDVSLNGVRFHCCLLYTSDAADE